MGFLPVDLHSLQLEFMDYTPYHLQTFGRNSRNIEERGKVNNLQALQSLSSVPGLQERLAMLLGVNAGMQDIQLGGSDAAYGAAMQHENVLTPDRNAAMQALGTDNKKLIDFYNNVHTPAQNAADERLRLYEFLQQLTGNTTFMLPRQQDLQ